jgi:hypothetical protein
MNKNSVEHSLPVSRAARPHSTDQQLCPRKAWATTISEWSEKNLADFETQEIAYRYNNFMFSTYSVEWGKDS